MTRNPSDHRITLDCWRSVENDSAILNPDQASLGNPGNVHDGFGHFAERSSGKVNLPPSRADDATLLDQRVDNALANLICKHPTGLETNSITRKQRNLPVRGINFAKILNLRTDQRQYAAILEINLPSVNHRCRGISLKKKGAARQIAIRQVKG